MRSYTRDHDVIRSWAGARGAEPARVKGTQVLRIAFDKLPPNWEAMNWQEFFEIFDRTAQSFLYDDTPGSRICKLTRGPRPGPIAHGP